MLAAGHYTPRRVGEDLLHQVLTRHLDAFLSRCEEAGRPMPRWVEEELCGYLACGDARRGFRWFTCAHCEHALVLPFTCHGRGFYPSCMGGA